ncbi:hypothetical protein [Bernardetia sp.]|uniref:hypothetical protein n=1 Tax=Bernardetia sp. TaxID=1937974 RepID=UPI0025B840F8|nr:hypothetical protein [Bernardetia sp.]
MKSLITPIVFSILFLFPVLSFAQDVEIEIEESSKEKNKDEKRRKKRSRVIVIEQDELDDIKEEIRIDLKELKRELKSAFKEIEGVDWEEVNEEIEIAMEEAKQGLAEANRELANIRIEIDEDFEMEIEEELEEIREEFEGMEINGGSPRIRIMTQNSRPYKRNIERNFSDLTVDSNTELSDKMKKGTTTTFDETVQNSVKVTPKTKEGKFTLSFALSAAKADKKTTYIEVYDSNDNVIYFESLVDFSGAYQGEIDLAVNGADNYTLVVRQGTKYMSRKISLK